MQMQIQVDSGSHGMNAKSTGATSPGNSLEMQILRPYWIRNSGGKGPQSVFLKAFSRWFWCALKFDKHWVKLSLEKSILYPTLLSQI